MKRDPKNARKHGDRNKALIRESLETVGPLRSIGVDGDNVIRAGNGVYEQAEALGLKVRVVDARPNELIAVRRKDLRGKKAVRAALYDNRTGELSEWDTNVLFEIAEHDGDLVGRMFEGDKEILAAIALPTELMDAEPQVDRAEELRKKWGVESGQLWQLGEHRLLCGDSTKPDDVERVMQDDRAAMVFTDPPYGVAIGNKNKFLNSFQPSGRNLENIAGDLMGKDELFDMLVGAFSTARVKGMANCCAVYVTAPQGGELGLMMMMMMMSGLPVRHVLNWIKNQPTFSLGRLDYEYQHEPILFTWNKTHKHFGNGRHRTSTWFIDKPRASKDHPTIKPIELVENALLNSSQAGDIVFDFFLGVGTTLIACENLGRKCRAIEINPAYVAVTLQRFQDATGKTPVLVDNGNTQARKRKAKAAACQ